MGKAKITITGVPEKKPKINIDGTVDMLFKIPMSTGVPKGLKSLGDSFYLVHIGPKTWKKVEDRICDDSFYIIQGEPKASVNTKGVPFFEVVCFDISIKEQAAVEDRSPKKVEAAAQEEKEPLKDKTQSLDNQPEGTERVVELGSINITRDYLQTQPNPEKVNASIEYIKNNECLDKPIILEKDSPILIDGYTRYLAAKELNLMFVPVAYKVREVVKTPETEREIKKLPVNRKNENSQRKWNWPQWYSSEEIVEISAKDVILTEKEHLYNFRTVLRDILPNCRRKGTIPIPLAVRPIEDNKYSLVMGLKYYTVAKVLNFEKVPVVIRDMSHAEFIKLLDASNPT